jgi:hypothetical protein
VRCRWSEAIKSRRTVIWWSRWAVAYCKVLVNTVQGGGDAGTYQ